jgi:hypothetical protein
MIPKYRDPRRAKLDFLTLHGSCDENDRDGTSPAWANPSMIWRSTPLWMVRPTAMMH